ncbi:LysR family transcriptional regulator [Microbacterium trichothecenolyticum]|uniref:DNA-binding transcriptional LysR family regulator n=1 Tax=Microbacterium trichothecenolyticum TaxID=69370 RepID=A0ABU0TQB9_MICTR|nr:LysR family transcriptional regulator [Microbacterium trichothecenolyticum]MDQ1121863.1 DNA-binding transcriptional LysR family regulator [Microbacterium trichothecenolyticum]
MSITLAQLRAFLGAFELGSFTAAGNELGMGQASVSELVARLEAEIGAPLFHRRPRRLVPTEAARTLREHACRSVDAADQGVAAVQDLSRLQSGTCTFGVLRNAAYYRLSTLLHDFHRAHPGVSVRMVGLNSALVARSIANGELEAGLVVLPVDDAGLTVRPVLRDEVLFAFPTGSLRETAVGIDDVAARKLALYDAYAGWDDPTRRQLRERARLAGLTLHAAIEVESVETALGLVALGEATTIVASRIAEAPGFPAGVSVVPFAEPLYDTIALVHREGAVLSPATRRMSEMAIDLLQTAPASPASASPRTHEPLLAHEGVDTSGASDSSAT